MTAKTALQLVDILIVLLGASSLITLSKKQLTRSFAALAALLLVRSANAAVAIGTLFHRQQLGLSRQLAYSIYLYSFWTSQALQAALEVVVIYAMYRIAMKPLEGLRNIGSIIFAWVSCVSLVLSFTVFLGPHTDTMYFASLLGNLQECINVLSICLLLFVCFAARPLGLTYRSRPFGVMLGLGISSTASLVLSTWEPTTAAQSVYSPIFVVGAIAGAASMVTWLSYFALPEPERQMVMLPTTSPYFTWNRISAALGDAPGMVVIDGFRPSMLANAEVAAFKAVGAGVSEFGGPSAKDPSLAASLAMTA
ncbi:hypothetical protein ACFQBQ_14100 [Granulicella cerasi]|uniref:Uncharacterized protein n=1 Tax=Granulicella cerasi TaxID=741063 RepID=A0ABW1ZBB5_9BACT|nr:hypothetical protein [Granulicella cerasi]